MQEIAEAMKALSEEIRLRLLLLLGNGELCVCDLMAALGLPQSTISRHLAYLKNSGWVASRRQGIWMHYRLADPLGPFRQETLDRLRRELKDAPQAKKDAANLALHLKTQQDGNRCA